MFEIYNFSEAQILSFILVMMRVSVFFVTWPVFGTNTVPAYAKILLSLVFTMIMFSILVPNLMPQKEIEQFFFWLLLREAFVGVAMGFVARFFFFALSITAQMVSDAVGLSSAQLFNPMTDHQGSAVDQFYLVLATLFFLSVNGHHVFISGLAQSYELVPLATEGLNLATLPSMKDLVQQVMLTGVKLAAPVFISIFCMNIAMGIVGRAVPQVNVLITSMPVNVMVGLLVMIVSIPLLLTSMGDLLNQTMTSVFGLLRDF